MVKRLVFALFILVVLFTPVLPARPAAAISPPEFYATPSAVMFGGTVVFTGTGFPAEELISLYLITEDMIFLGEFFSDTTGNFSGSLALGIVEPGVYDIMAMPGDIVSSITILPALTLDLAPTGGPPGTIVHFFISNLAAGQLRLDYEGIPVFGPVDVPAGIFEGDFLVPADRPDPLGVDAEVKAVNLLGGSTLGTAVTYFVSEPGNPSPYTITNILLPPDGVEPGYTFNLSGQISPPPIEPLTNYQLKILYKSGSGQVVPITVGTPDLQPSGFFSAQAKIPSLLAGDPLVPEPDGQVGVVFFDNGYQQNSTLQLAPWIDPPDPVFKVKVVDQFDQPIQGALVDIRAFYSDFGEVSGGNTSGGVIESLTNNYSQHPNQVGAYLGALATGESDPFTCKQTNVYGRTDENGIFEVKFDPASFAMLGKKIIIGYTTKPIISDVSADIEFPIYVNAIYKGYGDENGLPQPYTRDLRFSGITHLFYDVVQNHTVPTNPYIVKLKPLAAGSQLPIPIVPKAGYVGYQPGLVVGGLKNFLGTGIPLTGFGNFYSFPLAQFPNAWFYGAMPNVYIEFQHDSSLFGALDESKLKLTLNGVIYPFVNSGQKYEGNANCPAIVYRATIPNLHRFAAGNYIGMIEIQDISDNITKHYVQLNIKPAPTWILQPQYKERHIYPNYFGGIKLQGYQYPPGDPNSTSNLDTDVPKVGSLQNRVNFGDEVSELLYPDKTSGMKYESQADGTVMNQATGPKNYNGTMAGGKEIVIPSTTITVLDTGKMPLYRYVIGVPPIAGATLGADMWIDATLTTSGKIQFFANGTTSTSLLVYPDATVGVDAFLEGEVLFGLASASAHAKPDIGMGMPATFVNGGLQDTEKCFHYKLVVSWKAKVGVCPLCKKWSDSDTVFNDRKPPSCAPPPAPSAASLEGGFITAETPEPPTASPSLAVDGLGHTLMVWSDESNNIQSNALSGGSLVGQFTVTNTMRGIDPQVAFYAPNKAVAVWTESAMVLPYDPLTTTFEQFFQAQHLKFALWNGSSWGAAQNLTLPSDSNGEGKVVLAGCSSSKTGCPANGEVTAVWVRDMGASYSERKFRLFYAAFNGASWSAPAAVDAASTGTDAEATLAYAPSGVAQVVWVRDPDLSLSTATDRLLYHRQLSGGSPVTPLTALPDTAVEPSLAVNSTGEMVLAFTVATDPTAFMGNQRQLHAAKQSCGEGGCTWSYNPLVDSNGRPVHAETPTMTLNNSGQAQITYRALGFGAAYEGGPTVLPGDPLGTVIGTGEIAQAFVTVSGVSTAFITPSYKTSGVNTVWQTIAVFDPVMNQTYTAASQGSGPTLPLQAVDMLTALGYTLDGLAEVPEPVAFSVASAVRDFSISDVTPSTYYPQVGGDPLTVTVSILNNGPLFASDRESGYLDLILAWDAPAGLGAFAGGLSIPVPIEPGGTISVEFTTADDSLLLPDFPHLPHTLYVQVNPRQTIAESDFENNTFRVELGSLPAPQGLMGVAQPGSSAVFLEWLPVEHEAVAGYRVYRSSDGRIFDPVGSSFIPGFLDLSPIIGETYLYTVVAYAADGFESDFATPIQAQIDQLFPVFLPVIVR